MWPLGGSILGRVTDSRSPESSAVERILAYMLFAIVVLSIGCFVAIMAGTWSGMSQADFNQGAWPAVAILPLYGLPIAFLMLIAIIIINGIRRSRAARDHGQSR